MWKGCRCLVWMVLLCGWWNEYWEYGLLFVNASRLTTSSSSLVPVVLSLRNGGGDKRRKRRRKKKEDGERVLKEQFDKQDDSLLGDAIRQRAETLLQDEDTMIHHHPTLSILDASLHSLGTGLGCSSPTSPRHRHRLHRKDEEEGGGVEVSFSAVVAQYFLQSHGGAHGFQCIASLLAVLFSMASFLTSNNNKNLLVIRALTCAMMKHASGLLAAAILSAQRIPQVGFRNTQSLLHRHPVSQYLFYCSLWILYLHNSSTATTTKHLPWMIHTAILGPILLREFISTILVLSDIFVLYHHSQATTTTTSRSGGKSVWNSFLASSWSMKQPKVQTKLANYVRKLSMIMELITAIYMSSQTMKSIQQLLLANSKKNLRLILVELFCTKLYLAYIIQQQRQSKKTSSLFTPKTTNNNNNNNNNNNTDETRSTTKKRKKKSKKISNNDTKYK